MANIPIEKTGTPWWLWLLGLLLLGLLLWFLIDGLGDDGVDAITDDDVEVVDDDIAVAPLPAVEETALDLSNLYVTRVTGDRTFFVAPSEAMSDQETLVILDQNYTPNVTGIEGQVDINAGQRIALSDGSMEPLGDASLDDLGLADDDVNAMTSDTDVIRVDGGDVRILEAPMGEEAVEVGA